MERGDGASRHGLMGEGGGRAYLPVDATVAEQGGGDGFTSALAFGNFGNAFTKTFGKTKLVFSI